MSEPYLHNIDPFAIQFFSGFGIRWYGLSYLAGFLVLYGIARWMSMQGKTPMSAPLIGDFIVWIAVGTVGGGRLGYCFFYRPELLIDFSASAPFWGVFAVNKGGMASHGGMIGVTLACYFFARRNKLSWLHLADLTALGATIGIFFGRIANFINGELVGRVCRPDYPLAVKFPQDMISWPVYHPEKLHLLADVVPLKGVTRETWLSWTARMGYSPEAWQSVNETIERLITAIQQGSTQVASAVAPLLEPRYPSQLFAALLEGFATFLVLAYAWRKPQTPGVIGSFFLSFYAVARVLNEQYRLPDLHLGYQFLSLTRGQWLSVALLGVGLLMYFLSSRSKQEPVGGWMTPRKSS